MINQLTHLPVYQLNSYAYDVYRITFKIQIRNMKFEIQDN